LNDLKEKEIEFNSNLSSENSSQEIHMLIVPVLKLDGNLEEIQIREFTALQRCNNYHYCPIKIATYTDNQNKKGSHQIK